MLLVRTKVLPSKIHGLGLFADQLIPKNTLIWKFLPSFDQRFTPEQIKSFPAIVQEYLATYSSFRRESELHLLCGDNCNWMNHSDNPNCQSKYEANEPEMPTYALRDIEPGEELIENYSDYEDQNKKIF